jgi:hypothetical protein
MPAQGSFTAAEAHQVGEQIGIDWPLARFDVEQFRMGMDVELEHGLHDPATNVTNDDPIATGKIALAHLNEFPDYRPSASTGSTEPSLISSPQDTRASGSRDRRGGAPASARRICNDRRLPPRR